MILISTNSGSKNRASVSPHRHEQWEWHYVGGGASGFAIDGRTVRVRAGDCFLIPPGTIHGVRLASREEWLLQYIALVAPEGPDDHALLDRLVRRAGRAGVIAAGTGALPSVAQICRDAETGDAWRRRGAASRLHALLCDLASDRPVTGGDHPAIGAALALMQRRIGGRLTMREVAATAGADASYVSRLFRRTLGQPPLRHFMHLKLRAAGELLEAGRSVGEAAALVGFGDPYHFSRRFSRWAGIAPSAWRGRGARR